MSFLSYSCYTIHIRDFPSYHLPHTHNAHSFMSLHHPPHPHQCPPFHVPAPPTTPLVIICVTIIVSATRFSLTEFSRIDKYIKCLIQFLEDELRRERERERERERVYVCCYFIIFLHLQLSRHSTPRYRSSTPPHLLNHLLRIHEKKNGNHEFAGLGSTQAEQSHLSLYPFYRLTISIRMSM